MLIFSINIGGPLVMMLVGEWSYMVRIYEKDKRGKNTQLDIHSFTYSIMEDDDQKTVCKYNRVSYVFWFSSSS